MRPGPSPDVPPGKKPRTDFQLDVGIRLCVKWYKHGSTSSLQKSRKLGEKLKETYGRIASCDGIKSELKSLNEDNSEHGHARFFRTMDKHMDDLKDPTQNQKVLHIQFKCPTAEGAMEEAGHEGEYALDQRRDEDLPAEVYDKLRNHCVSARGPLVIEEAMDKLPDWRYEESNTRQNCIKKDGRCADPNSSEGYLNAEALNLVGFAHMALGVEFHYLGMGGKDGMKMVTDKLNPACFTSIQSVYHTSYIAR